MYTTLISAAQLRQLLDDHQPVLVMDCSFDLTNPAAGRQQFEAAHIPGAVHVDLDEHLSEKTAPDRASGGRHPLPSREAFARRLRALGLNPGQQVVAMDRQGANYCGRLWWMLKWCGHEAVAVLDGGLAAWQATGAAVAQGTSPVPAAGRFELQPSLARTRDAQVIARSLGQPDQVLVDARAAARFRGEIEPLDPVAGHIPGALNRPFTDNIGPDGRFKPAAELRADFERLLAGRDPAAVVHHCGSGVSAIPNLLAMEIAGLGRTALFPGSWSEWCNTPGLPCARSQVPG
ncbi:sulfurtransferase [Hydrogenophaga pseudoflava]|uniref:sulfurtransferase n=1 Tax=Hydrogenophaga pseudoflava TaxID=47421 RepID=UPI0027E5BD4F|nr:sulfurtransferase [Hydrogenophaga pseudoflava]MDQ7743984.1 sulfurtransferase [Hydrogenophaga pseudoflava]